MKALNLLLIPLMYFSVIWVRAQSPEMLYEDQYYQCILQAYEIQGVELTEVLDSVEQALVDHQVLADKSGAAKMVYFQNRSSPNYKVAFFENRFIDTLQAYYIIPDLNKCRVKIDRADSSLFIESRLKKVADALNDSVKRMELKPENISRAMTQIYTADLMEHPLFRYQMLFGYAFTIETERPYLKEVPDTPEQMVGPKQD